MELGPTGYPFEDFIAKILEADGYKTKTRTIVQGKCISHEIDVIAEKNTVIPTKILVEAKFHNQMGIRTNVHVPMYTKSRFEDIKEKNGFSEVWLATNTKATQDAIAYANCVGMKIITWGYPENRSLRDLIEKYRLYPITALTTLSKENKQKLLEKGIVTCNEIDKNSMIFHEVGISNEDLHKIKKEVEFIRTQN
jgi:Holliday junction resolvase-like predicted endonuclease